MKRFHPIWAYRRWRRPDQAWYWTPEWQAGERSAEADIRAGRVRTYTTADELMADLDEKD